MVKTPVSKKGKSIPEAPKKVVKRRGAVFIPAVFIPPPIYLLEVFNEVDIFQTPVRRRKIKVIPRAPRKKLKYDY